MELQKITPRQLAQLLAKTIPAHLPILITGMPGIGKTDVVSQATALADADLILSHPAVADPTDAKGLPWPAKENGEATFLPFGELARALKATKPTVWFLDDLGQATPAVQAAYMQLILARRVNGHVLPDCVTFIAATNRRTDRAGVSGILEPVKSRFAAIVELQPNLDDWCNWAFDNEVPATLIAFIRFRSELLANFQPSADLTNSPVPRTWAHLAKIEALNLPSAIEAAAFAGAVGEAAAVEYIGFRRLAASIGSIDAILLDPSNAPIPTSPSELYATVVGLASKANVKTFSRIAVYADRLAKADRGEFAVFMVRDCTRRDPKIAYTESFVKLNSGKVGELITGQVRD